MKKTYNSPELRIRVVKTSEIIVTSDPQISDDPSDDGQQLVKRRERTSDWDNY